MTALSHYLNRARRLLDQHFADPTCRAWRERHWSRVESALAAHGKSAQWEALLQGLPPLEVASTKCGRTVMFAGNAGERDLQSLASSLRALCPWRKGPFDLFGIHIDAEWRSDLKWARVVPNIKDLSGRRVLDVGCGNGYYAWRMLAAGAAIVVGLDPGVLSVNQFRALAHYDEHAPIVILPLASDALDSELACFDTVLSMGVLYHRRDVMAHLVELRRALRSGGELVLETLILDCAGDTSLEPTSRYAQMRNVWTVPSPDRVMQWLRAAGFSNARCVDVTVTTTDEQRTTTWMPYQSLSDFLDPHDPTRTIEAYPAPVRGIFIAQAD